MERKRGLRSVGGLRAPYVTITFIDLFFHYDTTSHGLFYVFFDTFPFVMGYDPNVTGFAVSPLLSLRCLMSWVMLCSFHYVVSLRSLLVMGYVM